jgi:hypothetical protein
LCIHHRFYDTGSMLGPAEIDRVVEVRGYASTVTDVLRLVVPTMILPTMVAAGVAGATKASTRPAIAYGLAMLITLLAVMGGVTFAVFTLMQG